jgi:hypothetical protein
MTPRRLALFPVSSLLRRYAQPRHQRSLREISAELAKLGFVNERGAPFSPSSVERRTAYKAAYDEAYEDAYNETYAKAYEDAMQAAALETPY